MSYDNILMESSDGIVRLTLNRPDKMNSFNAAMHAELRDALDRVQADSSARVLVLTTEMRLAHQEHNRCRL